MKHSVSYKIAENLVVHARYGVATIALTNFKPTSNVAAGGKLFDFPSGTLPKSMRPGTELCLTTFGSTSLPAVLYVGRDGALYMTVANAWESGWGFTASATWTTA